MTTCGLLLDRWAFKYPDMQIFKVFLGADSPLGSRELFQLTKLQLSVLTEVLKETTNRVGYVELKNKRKLIKICNTLRKTY